MLIKNFSYRIAFILITVITGLLFISASVLLLNIDNLKIMQAIQLLLLFAFPAVFCAKFFDETPFSFLNLQKTSAKNYFFAAIFAFSAIPAINFFAWLNAQMRLPKFLHSIEIWMRASEDELMKITEQMLSVNTLGGLGVNLVVIAFMAAVCEELFFRGLLQKTLSEKIGGHLAIWLSAIIFSAIHLQFYGFLPRMLLGAAFGYMTFWSGSLFLPVLTHFLNNALSVIVFFTQKKQNLNLDIDSIGTNDFWYFGLIFLPVCIYFLWEIKNARKNF